MVSTGKLMTTAPVASDKRNETNPELGHVSETRLRWRQEEQVSPPPTVQESPSLLSPLPPPPCPPLLPSVRVVCLSVGTPATLSPGRIWPGCLRPGATVARARRIRDPRRRRGLAGASRCCGHRACEPGEAGDERMGGVKVRGGGLARGGFIIGRPSVPSIMAVLLCSGTPGFLLCFCCGSHTTKILPDERTMAHRSSKRGMHPSSQEGMGPWRPVALMTPIACLVDKQGPSEAVTSLPSWCHHHPGQPWAPPGALPDLYRQEAPAGPRAQWPSGRGSRADPAGPHADPR